MTTEPQPKQISRASLGAAAAILTFFGAIVILFAYIGASDMCSGTGTGCNASAIICAHGESIFTVFAVVYVLVFPLAYVLVLLRSMRWWKQLFALHIIYLVATTVFWTLPFLSVRLAPCFGALRDLYTLIIQL